ncbi:MAG: glutamine synthetase [Coriobacteriia bacterium]|nr:glutamine synthetase [Coriobacteriia bacterium]MBN2823020.1 glutamine synthetase [Coriobacteriia bacterium]
MAPKFDKEYVLKTVEERGIRFIRFWFTDVLGQMKSFAIADTELELAFEEGMGFDGSSIDGYTRIQESDMVAFPDPSTFKILPWRPSEGGVASMFCDIQLPDGTPFMGDPRFALKRNLEKAASMGFNMYVGPELEFFYFADDQGTEVLDKGGYFDLTPLDLASNLRRETVLTLEKLGIAVEYSHHEVAPSQHEIDLRYAEASEMADIVMTYRLAVKEVAHANGAYATFMPKPIAGENGSGMHVHQSLFDKSGNAFFDANDPQGYNLSATAKSYIAGLLKYAPEFCAVTNQFVNSYKRLVPGYEAPVYISWARRNRSALVRVPMYKPGKENATRIELRSPDPSANPYLAFAVMLGAGLKGIEEGLELMPEANNNIFEMTEAELAAAGITTLPSDLGEAIVKFENSELMKEVLGDHIHKFFVENKKAEWNQYQAIVTEWELDKYLSVL